jgi:uncharacterized Zn-finger protein
MPPSAPAGNSGPHQSRKLPKLKAATMCVDVSAAGRTRDKPALIRIYRTSDQLRDHAMAGKFVPHLANDEGAEKIFVGVKEFNCMGARAPFDHPHVYLDMGLDGQVLCPYCSTLFVHDARLSETESDPKGSIVNLAGHH